MTTSLTTQKIQRTIALYQQLLKAFPDSIDATAIQSLIPQLQKQLDEQ